jgi:hypothetical protein
MARGGCSADLQVGIKPGATAAAGQVRGHFVTYATFVKGI